MLTQCLERILQSNLNNPTFRGGPLLVQLFLEKCGVCQTPTGYSNHGNHESEELIYEEG